METNITTTIAPPDDLLQEANDKMAVMMVPAVVYCVVLMLTGLLGNIMVCVYYGCQTRPTTNTTFIIALAVFDLITCSISVPIEIIDLRYFYMFENSAACKIMRFINHFASIGSAATLLAISVDRFKRICKPFKKQLTLKDAKMACVLASALSVTLSWPALVFYGSSEVDVTYDGHVIIGRDCTTSKDESFKTYLWVFNVTHFALFFITTIALAVMYSMIGRNIMKHNKSQNKYVRKSVSSESRADDLETSPATNLSSQPQRQGDITEPKRTETRRRSNVTSHNPQLDLKTVKYTIIMLVITVVFVLSFLPYLALIIWRLSSDAYEVDILSDLQLVAFQIGIRSYLLNSCLNPVLYGFFNPRFRAFFYRILCPCCDCHQNKLQLSSSSQDRS